MPEEMRVEATELTDPKNFVKYNQRPISMYETREGHKHNFNQNSMSQVCAINTPSHNYSS